MDIALDQQFSIQLS